jgi:hypothetical protein
MDTAMSSRPRELVLKKAAAALCRRGKEHQRKLLDQAS